MYSRFFDPKKKHDCKFKKCFSAGFGAPLVGKTQCTTGYNFAVLVRVNIFQFSRADLDRLIWEPEWLVGWDIWRAVLVQIVLKWLGETLSHTADPNKHFWWWNTSFFSGDALPLCLNFGPEWSKICGEGGKCRSIFSLVTPTWWRFV